MIRQGVKEFIYVVVRFYVAFMFMSPSGLCRSGLCRRALCRHRVYVFRVYVVWGTVGVQKAFI